MGKRVIFTEAQMKHICECNGINPDMLKEDGEGMGGATSCASVGAETSRGDIGYDAPAFDSKKNKNFWKDSLVHQKPGGVSMERQK